MLAKDLFQLKEQSVLVVTGLLIGEVSVGDTVYVIGRRMIIRLLSLILIRTRMVRLLRASMRQQEALHCISFLRASLRLANMMS